MSILSRLRDAYNRTFRRAHYVYRYEGDPVAPDPRLTLARHESAGEVPEDARDALRRWGGEHAWTCDVLEMTQGAALFVGRADGAVVSAWLSRPGYLFQRWLVPLGPLDIVLFRGHTAPECRGRGFSPAMMRAIVARERVPGAAAWVDVSVHNVPSIRAIEKAGFRRFARVMPLSRKAAYGEFPPGKLLGCPFGTSSASSSSSTGSSPGSPSSSSLWPLPPSFTPCGSGGPGGDSSRARAPAS